MRAFVWIVLIFIIGLTAVAFAVSYAAGYRSVEEFWCAWRSCPPAETWRRFELDDKTGEVSYRASRDTRKVLFTKDQSEQPDIDEIIAPKLPAHRVVHVHCRHRVNKCTVDFWIAGSETLPDARAAQRVQITYVSSGYPDLRVEYVGRQSIELAIVGDWLRRVSFNNH